MWRALHPWVRRAFTDPSPGGLSMGGIEGVNGLMKKEEESKRKGNGKEGNRRRTRRKERKRKKKKTKKQKTVTPVGSDAAKPMPRCRAKVLVSCLVAGKVVENLGRFLIDDLAQRKSGGFQQGQGNGNVESGDCLEFVFLLF